MFVQLLVASPCKVTLSFIIIIIILLHIITTIIIVYYNYNNKINIKKQQNSEKNNQKNIQDISKLKKNKIVKKWLIVLTPVAYKNVDL